MYWRRAAHSTRWLHSQLLVGRTPLGGHNVARVHSCRMASACQIDNGMPWRHRCTVSSWGTPAAAILTLQPYVGNPGLALALHALRC
jgi:hypothetical protein